MKKFKNETNASMKMKNKKSQKRKVYVTIWMHSTNLRDSDIVNPWSCFDVFGEESEKKSLLKKNEVRNKL